ncbi:uncharacterized protein VICG_01178 [Vittaforma corneae ATCC 50505]|uniref:Uncharacterized protein n=1 Tax=Vittaforma corneae (strain ATCC 50505) TaxID=993615 RepID=L2GLV0_VITCO|nr:uncharacterized protein VICG_01178 [Vittaforma corneae ATCC 50505]ELA41826.1 hypothetical protein VICG_01178 [Vittaforma corneae ATCC 50505]
MSQESIRLKVELNSMIKFYVRTHQKSSLNDLKKAINNILKTNYNITIPSYALRSSDWFEVLDIYTVGDVLEDNQVVMIDPFTSMHLSLNKKKLPFQLLNKELSETDTSPKPVYTAEKAVKKSRVSIQESQPMPVQSVTEKIPRQSILEKITEPTVTLNQKKMEKTEELQKESPEPEKKVEVSVQNEEPLPVPPRPDNFKGFVVNIPDLNKSQGIKINESSFKPLKKRRVDEDRLEIEL